MMIITIFFIIVSIGVAVFIPIYTKKTNRLYSFTPHSKSERGKKKDIRKLWGISEIKDGILCINGKFCIILELGGIEYKLLNDEEQNNIDSNLIKLAKTFSNQTQFFSTTEKIDTREKIESIRQNIEEQKNNNIKEYGYNIMEYLENIMQEDNLFVRKNYCIIESYETFEKAKIELEKYYQEFKQSLSNINIKTKRLSDIELIEFINREFNKNQNEKIKNMIAEGGLDLYVQAR